MPTPEEPKPPRRTRAAEVVDAGTEAIDRVGRLTPQQAITVLAVLLVGLIGSTSVYQSFTEREDRKAAVIERQEAVASLIRESRAQSEMIRRQHEADNQSMRAFFADQEEKRRRFEAEERAKDRARIDELTRAVERIRRLPNGEDGGND